jgi:predicted dehydrogenase
MKKKILIVGFGEMGQRYYNLLSKSDFKIFILTKRKLLFKNAEVISNLKDTLNYNFNYIIISSETYQHFKQVIFFEKNFKKIKILIEKPIFEKFRKINLRNNIYFVGYNLRQMRIINYLKKKVNFKNFFLIEVICTSFLPDWKKNRKYTDTYSSSKKKGGGALLELSHEIDYIKWLLGDFKLSFCRIEKISKLKINAEDDVIIIGKKNKIKIKIHLNICSKIVRREINLSGDKFNYSCNLLNNEIKIFEKKNVKKIIFKNDTIKKTYSTQLNNFLGQNCKNLCSYQEALNTLKFIESIKKL